MILHLQKAKEEIEATGETPQDLKQNIFAIWTKFESFWPLLENAAQGWLEHVPKLSPEERPSNSAWITITSAIRFVEELGRYRTTGVMEVAIAQHVIPDRDVLDRILRYETANERSLGRALDRLERLQRRRKGEPIPPPMSVRLTR